MSTDILKPFLLAGDPVLRNLATIEQRKRNAEKLALRNVTRTAADTIAAGQSRQVRRAFARKGGKGRG